jgi:hypothetical protein
LKTSEKRKSERQMVLYILNAYLYIFYAALCMSRIFLYGSSLLLSFCINKIKMLHFWRICRLRKGLGSCCIEYMHGQITVPCIVGKEKQGSIGFLFALCIPVILLFLFVICQITDPGYF